MNTHMILEQAFWRLRAYWCSPGMDASTVGWRRDSTACPIAEWLFFEGLYEDLALETAPSVDAEWIIWRGEMIATPPMLSSFIDLLDARQTASCGESTRVSRIEALQTLLQAEHRVSQRLLPMQAESLPRCDYRSRSDEACPKAASSGWIYCFLDHNQSLDLHPRRSSCRLFVGRLCDEHSHLIVVPPESWWPQESLEQQNHRAIEVVGAKP